MSLLYPEAKRKNSLSDKLVELLTNKGVVGAENHLIRLLDSQTQAFSILDRDLRFVYISNTYKSILEIEAADSQILGTHVTEFIGKNILNKDASMVSENRLYAAYYAMATKETGTFLRATRTGKDVMVTVSPLLDDSGEILFIIQSLKNLPDIDELRKQNLAFYEALGIHSINKNASPIFQSKCMQEVAERALLAAGVDVNVLITGESGVGKDVIAKYIQEASPRGNQQFIQVNCSAIPDALLESELFGYEDGAFTGARKKGKIGLIEIANKGTLFLDEIGDMPLPLQAKLLNFLQDRYFFRVGGIEKVKVDIRVIAATNVNLEEKVKLKQFREDLYYRLNVIPIRIPPLRERPEDIIPMANEFLSQFNKKYKQDKQFSFDAQCLLPSYTWPGNVRELKNCIERLVVLTGHQQITGDIIKKDLSYQAPDLFPEGSLGQATSLDNAKELVEYQLLKLAAQQFNSHRQIAKALGTSHTNVSRKLEQYGIVLNN
ncbi:MAG: sigma 54-interacting transcriptional regulator [Thermincola sp.]|jgi:TyrR family helix-turn-helix protein|nr:sigma 54-interacting transcriptional regulator [Thermincola sp.]MDT3703336.1 sigma 54-interacting transcriptional regulator [Thermincola sp.]